MVAKRFILGAISIAVVIAGAALWPYTKVDAQPAANTTVQAAPTGCVCTAVALQPGPGKIYNCTCGTTSCVALVHTLEGGGTSLSCK
jgi:hypothetical protein